MNINQKVFRDYITIQRQISMKRASLTQVRTVQIIFKEFSRDERLVILSNLCGRKINSANDLWNGEAKAIIEESIRSGFWDLCTIKD